MALLALALIPSVALAAETRPLERTLNGTFAEPDHGSSVTLTNPGGVAIDEVTGNVFLGDATNTVFILGANNGKPLGLVSPYQLTGFSFTANTNGVAFNNSNGTLYVANPGGIIKRFTRNLLTEKYEPLLPDLSATGGTFTSGNAGLAVDTTGNLFYANNTCQCVVKFNSAGVQVAFYNLVGTAPQPNGPNSVAVDGSGNLFVARAAGQGSIFKYPAAGLPADGSGPAAPSQAIQVLSAGSGAFAVGTSSNKLFVALRSTVSGPTPGPARVAQYDATSLTKEFEFGGGALGVPARVTVNSSTNRVYVSETGSGAGKKNVAVFGPPITLPTVTTNAASEVTGTKATLNGIVNPKGNVITECKFEYGPTAAFGKMAPCEGATPADSSDHAVTAAISGLTPNGATYHFRLWVNSVNGEASPQGGNRTFVTDDTVFTEPATGVDDTVATLNGIIRPEGEQLTNCKFEYGTTSEYGQSVPCAPAFGLIPDDFDPHAVTGALSGLDPNTAYHFRLTATNAKGTALGEDRGFTTFGPPQIIEQQPIDATQDAVTLQARIDPSGSSTSYRFEFGAEKGSYGVRIPADHDLVAGGGTDPVLVSANRGGLQEKSVYWFRVVAVNSSGSTVGADQRLETLNEHGLPNDRGFELVSPAAKGPGWLGTGVDTQQSTQVSLDGESFVYPFINGYETSTAGGWLRHLAARADGEGWVSSQLSVPSLIRPPRQDILNIARPSYLLYVSADNSCGFIETYNPLTEDTPAASVELGLTNLYRWSAEGDYELVSNRLPLNPDLNPDAGNYYADIDASDDCSHVFFSSAYDFSPEAESGLYEWDEGTLRDAGALDNGEAGAALNTGGDMAVLGGEVLAGATARWNAVSPDGSRSFFTAKLNEGPNAGKPAIFMRTDGSDDVVEISASQTAVTTNGARFEGASPDGGRVFFRANYGIADTTSAGDKNGACGPLAGETVDGSTAGLEEKLCDLYSYDVETGELTDLSVEADSPGAQIQGVIAIDDDGSNVYFAALGQLIPGKGRTYAENIAGFGSANVYLARLDEDGKLLDEPDESAGLTYVTTLAERGPQPFSGNAGDLFGVSGGAAALMRRAGWAANTTPDGGKLLFASSLNLTGWESGAGYKSAAYLYTADDPSTPTVKEGQLKCVSCRPDGLPSVALPARSVPQAIGLPVIAGAQAASLLASPLTPTYRPLSLSEDGSRVVFTSYDVLAPGAVGGSPNAYQWEEGQVFFLGVVKGGGLAGLGGYQGMSADGEDVFIATSEQLDPRDRDSLSDVYDLRIGGGFAFTPDPPDCQVDEAIPLVPNQIYCQGTPGSQPAAASPSSPNGTGENVTSPGCSKGEILRGSRCLTKREIAQRRCAKVSGKAKRRCIRVQMQRLNRTGTHGRASK